MTRKDFLERVGVKDEFGVCLVGNTSCRIACSSAICRYVLNNDRTRSNRTAAAYFYTIYDGSVWPDVNIVAYCCRFFRMGTDGSKLENIDIVADNGFPVDDYAAAMVDIEAVADAGTRLNEKTVFLKAVHAPAGERKQPALVFAEAHVNAETHTRTGNAANPYFQHTCPLAVVAIIVALDEFDAVLVILWDRNTDFFA